MDISFLVVFTSVNIGFVGAGFYLMRRFCNEEDELWKKYRRIKDMEIRLLSSKINGNPLH